MIPLALVLAGCPGGGGDDSGETGSGDTSGLCTPMTDLPGINEMGCLPMSTDYQPLTNPAGDGFPACVTDDGTYHLIADTPSSIARVQAFEDVMTALAADPSPDGFTAARAIYAIDEGLESRVLRREDLHYPAVPEADWSDGVDPDKQCSVASNVEKYPERCAGPARIAPIVDDAFAAGQTGDVPEIQIARIDAALLWFLHLSVYKEANTCLLTEKDCDSAWAYYTGGLDRNGGIGLAEEVRALSDLAHQRIWDGFLAARCWRELYPLEMYPDFEADVPPEGQMLLTNAYDQLSRALWYGWAQIVRDHISQQSGACGLEFDANLAWLKIGGPVLSEEAERRDAAAAAPLAALWAADEPTVMQLEEAVNAIDALFACP